MHGKTSVRVVEKCLDIPVAAVQHTFTHKQYTAQHNETEYTERYTHNNMNSNGTYITVKRYVKLFLYRLTTAF
jgi:hypothetical protein